ncbi:hypothetical protein BBP40_006932 [Aspergillus hancockii]|nr:hypothetical protein BBP40_006932 [Aspergillus hancockii]
MAHHWAPAPELATELGRYRILSSTAGIRVSPLQLGGMRNPSNSSTHFTKLAETSSTPRTTTKTSSQKHGSGKGWPSAMGKAPNVFPLVGGRKVECLQDNIQAPQIRLTAEQIQYLESQKPFVVGFPGNFIGPDAKVTGEASFLLAAKAPYAFVRSAKSITSPQ